MPVTTGWLPGEMLLLRRLCHQLRRAGTYYRRWASRYYHCIHYPLTVCLYRQSRYMIASSPGTLSILPRVGVGGPHAPVARCCLSRTLQGSMLSAGQLTCWLSSTALLPYCWAESCCHLLKELVGLFGLFWRPRYVGGTGLGSSRPRHT